VKIDRAFIDPLQSAADAAVVRTMLELARALGLRVVAEGVETPAQRDALRQMGCEMAQGYLFGRPMDAETVFGSADLERGASPAA
jgi:EAL domain-containing protein (putative c-di-GMP-specific phosphodiesterase class I)